MSYVVELIKNIFPNTTIAFFYITLAVLTFWMYKEMRNGHIENNKNSQQRTDKAIDLYADLELEIYKFFNDKSDFFSIAEKMAKASSLMPYELLKKCNKCKEESDIDNRNELLKNFHELLKQEIISLKFRQNDPVTFKSEDNVIDYIENYVKTKIAPFLIPLGQTILNIIFLLVIVFFTILVINEPLTTHKILYVSVIIAAIVYATLVNILIGAVIMKGRFKHSTINWLLFSLFVVVPIIFIFIGPWYRGVILIVLLFAYGFYAAKRSIRESSQ